MLETENNLRIWLIGGTQGIGFALARAWLAQGARLVLSGRGVENPALEDLQAEYPERLQRVALDLAQPDTFEASVQQAFEVFNGLDVWFYNAGAYQPMTLETWDADACAQMNQVNYLAVTQLISPVFKRFKAQGGGRWVWNVSLASYFGLPYSGGYGPSKAALASLAESLQPELEAHGIQLQWINHGFVKSRLTDLNPFDMPQLMEADEAAAQILKGMASDSPEVHFPWRLAKGLRFLRLLPIGLALKLTRRLVK